MDFFNILSMIGGLALFLYGMDLLGEGLSRASGGRLEKILEKMTSNPLKAVLLGAGVTAVIQSSSATTVMVVGFVNSGIMKLQQAVGIIMGANIGTTATAWILSLSGIEGDNFFIQLLKPTSFSPVLALIGVIMIMFTKKEKSHNIGKILVGFAILMTGMDAMSAAVKPLADVPEFANILLMFSHPILGLLAGTILTAIIQSSSASVGILQALCQTGAVSYATALPIIMGQNIGTCVTALISAIGAKKNAKRAAMVHLFFNIVGTVLFMIVFYTINSFMEFAFLNTSATAAGIATIHSIFNVVATIVLLPFSKLLVKLATIAVPDEKEEETIENKLHLLDVRFLDTPGIAIEQCKNVAYEMSDITKKALFAATKLLHQYDEDKVREIFEIEDMVDKYEDEMGNYLVKLSAKDLSERDSHTVSVLLHAIGDFERISDHAVNIAQSAKEMYDKDQRFSNKASVELEVFTKALDEVVNLSFDVFRNGDMNRALQVEPLEDAIDDLQTEIKNRHIKRLRKGKCTIEMGFILSDVVTSYERISDHCSNIALCLFQVNDDDFEAHDYISKLKTTNDQTYADYFSMYKNKYMLP